MKQGGILSKMFMGSFDNVIDEFLKDQNKIFQNQTDRFKVFYPALHTKMNAWKKSKKCIYKGCTSNTIKRSHTITQNTFLTEIAEEGHVYSPQTNLKTGETIIKKVGINDASRFPGFCEEHEKLFHEFEKKKKIEFPDEVYNQMYRTVCREVIVKKHRLSVIEEMLEQYKSHRNKKLLEEIKRQPFMQFLQQNRNVQVMNFTFEHSADYLNDYLEKEIKKLKSDLHILYTTFLNRIHEELEEKHTNSLFSISAIKVEKQIPIALAGRSTFWVIIDEREIKVEIFINVLPSKSHTDIYFFSLKENQDSVWAYVNSFLKKDFGILALIETLMIHGSDHWFLKPSVWESITKKNQQQIVNDIMNLKSNIAVPYEKTIFNKIKRSELESFKGWDTYEQFMSASESEKKKFTDVD
jgi:hypothetical protein